MSRLVNGRQCGKKDETREWLSRLTRLIEIEGLKSGIFKALVAKEMAHTVRRYLQHCYSCSFIALIRASTISFVVSSACGDFATLSQTCIAPSQSSLDSNKIPF